MKNLRQQRNSLEKMGVIIVTCKPLGNGRLRIQVRRNGTVDTREIIKNSQARRKVPSLEKELTPHIGKKPSLLQKVLKEKVDIYFHKLLRATDSDGECPFCRKYPNREEIVIDTVDGGRQPLHQCIACKKIFRPYSSYYNIW